MLRVCLFFRVEIYDLDLDLDLSLSLSLLRFSIIQWFDRPINQAAKRSTYTTYVQGFEINPVRD